MPSLTLTQRQAAKEIGCSLEFFRQHVLPELKVIRRGRRTLIPRTACEAWVAKNAEDL